MTLFFFFRKIYKAYYEKEMIRSSFFLSSLLIEESAMTLLFSHFLQAPL